MANKISQLAVYFLPLLLSACAQYYQPQFYQPPYSPPGFWTAYPQVPPLLSRTPTFTGFGGQVAYPAGPPTTAKYPTSTSDPPPPEEEESPTTIDPSAATAATDPGTQEEQEGTSTDPNREEGQEGTTNPAGMSAQRKRPTVAKDKNKATTPAIVPPSSAYYGPGGQYVPPQGYGYPYPLAANPYRGNPFLQQQPPSPQYSPFLYGGGQRFYG